MIEEQLTAEQALALTKLPTPINRQRFVELLKASSYDPFLTSFIDLGLKNGFDVGFRGLVLSNPSVKNLKSAYEHPEVVTHNLKKELAEGRVLGPFLYPPFKKFQVSPLGCVEKKKKHI